MKRIKAQRIEVKETPQEDLKKLVDNLLEATKDEPTPVPTDATTWISPDHYTWGSPTGIAMKDFLFKPSYRLTKDDYEEEKEREELLTSDRNTDNYDRGPLFSKLDILLNKYKSSQDNIDLIKFLFKAGYINISHPCLNFEQRMLLGKANAATYIEERVKRDAENLMYSIVGEYNYDIKDTDMNNLKDILRNFYNTDRYNHFLLTIDTKEVYQELLIECTKKNIKLDEDFKDLKDMDFKALRSLGESINLFYSPAINYLIVTSQNRTGRRAVFADFYNHINLLPTQPIETATEANMIKINNVEYDKSVFESLVETDFDNFISNLEVESILNNIADEVVEKVELL